MSNFWSDSKKEEFLNHLIKGYGTAVSRGEIIEEAKHNGMPQPNWLLNDPECKASRGMYDLSKVRDIAPAMAAQVLTMPKSKPTEVVQGNLVPIKESLYVPFGFFKDLSKIVESKIFYPVFITGLSGNGKTTMVEQVCATLKRECIRVNISIETDEDDLIGGNTMVNGNIVYREGPVLMAMRRGAILLIDECDRGSNKLMCMQAIMEGKSYLNKKTGEIISPAPGFNIIATANTKGRGTEDGRFVGAQMIDEAFLERFAITVEQEFPNSRVEKKIVNGKMQELNCVDPDFADKLVTWAEIIRKTFEEGGIEELISTRRLLHIVKAFAMFDNRQKAIELCTNRFDEETKAAFKDLYNKVDAPAVNPDPQPAPINPNEEIPF